MGGGCHWLVDVVFVRKRQCVWVCASRLVGEGRQLREQSRWIWRRVQEVVLSVCLSVRLPVSLSCVDSQDVQWRVYSAARAKDLLLYHPFSDDTVFTLSLVRLQDSSRRMCYAACSSICGTDSTPCISLTWRCCYTSKQIHRPYTECIAATCFRIGKDCLGPHAWDMLLRRLSVTLYHSFPSGCSLTVIKAQADSMRHILKHGPSLSRLQNLQDQLGAASPLTNTCR